MAVEYDLVILGGTSEGFEAAAHAARYGARVALLLHGLNGRRSPLWRRGLLTLRGQHSQRIPTADLTPWQWANQRSALAAETLTGEDTERLMVSGVDVVEAGGTIAGDRPLTVMTPSRRLTTRAIILATGSHFEVPPLPGLDTVAYESPHAFWQRDELPASVIVLGSSPEGLLLAQHLSHWQVPVTVVTPHADLLNREDPDVSQWIAAQLRADGVDLRLGEKVSEVMPQEDQVALKISQEIVAASALVVAIRSVPNLANLELEQYIPCDRPLRINAFLQTEHPRIYACGAAIGGYDLPAVSRQEAHHAVHNALFWNRRRIDYSTIPYDLPTQPPVARVGLTEPQVRARFDEDEILVARRSLYDNPQAQWRESAVGFCKLIAHRTGRILGCHGVGPDAQEWVQTVALLMTQKVPWWGMATFPALPESLTELLRQTARQWERDRWRPEHWRRDWAENWCNWRRSR